MAFSDTKKCPDCGTVYYKNSKHICPYLCPDCDVKVFSTNIHLCDPKKVEEKLVEKFKSELRGAELTPRMRRHLEFLEWCRINERP
jgi:predicted  nucleic acid-binding Zn-ribbon protein